jgi:hypothetical protein
MRGIGYSAEDRKKDHLEAYGQSDYVREERSVEDLDAKRIDKGVTLAQRFSGGFSDTGQIGSEENGDYRSVERGVGPVIEIPSNLFAPIVHGY